MHDNLQSKPSTTDTGPTLPWGRWLKYFFCPLLAFAAITASGAVKDIMEQGSTETYTTAYALFSSLFAARLFDVGLIIIAGVCCVGFLVARRLDYRTSKVARVGFWCLFLLGVFGPFTSVMLQNMG